MRMFRKVVFFLSLLIHLFNSNVHAASIQSSLMTAVRTFMAERVIFEQFRERLIQSLQKNRSLDLSSLQALLDFYGIKQHVSSKNEAIEIIIKAYHSKHELVSNQDLSTNILQIDQELPDTVSHMQKFDFQFMNEAAGLTFLANAPRGVENHAITFHAHNFSAGLTLRPMSTGPTVYQLMAQDHARRDNLRFLIEHDPNLYLEYRIQRGRCIDQIKRMLDLSTNLDALTAQLSVNNLSLWDAYDEGVILTDWVKPGIQNLLFKDGNFVGVDTQEKLGKLLAIADKFFKETLSKQEYIKLLQEYTHRAIPGADILLKRALGTNGYWDAIKNYVAESISFYPAMIDSEIAQSPMIQNCVKIFELCKREKFDEARKIVASLQVYTDRDSKYRINEAHYLSLLVENEYSRVFNSYGIRYTDTTDPYYTVGKQILDVCPYSEKQQLQKALQETIKERSARLDTLLSGATKAQKDSPYIKAVGYKILDAQSGNEVVDILSDFAKDHPNENARNAYSVFVKKGLPSCSSANDVVKNVPMPASIELAVNQEIRKWYGYCAGTKIETSSQKELIQRALEHLSCACKENAYKDDHLYLAQRFYADATDDNPEKIFLKMPHLTSHDESSIQGQLERHVLTRSCHVLAQATDEKEICNIIEKANSVVEGIHAGRIRTVDEVEHAWHAQEESALLSGTSEIYPIKEHELIEEKFTPPYGCGSGFLDEFQRALFDFYDEVFEWEEPYGGACFAGSERAKNLFDPESQEIEEEIDLDAVPQCNAGQQTLPSFGDAVEDVKEREKDKDKNKNYDTEEAKNSEFIEEFIKSIIKEKVITKEHEQKLEEFKKEILKLAKEYNLDNVAESMEVYNVTLEKVLKRNVIIAIKKLSQMLSIVNSNDPIKTFKYDSAHKNNITSSSIQEALAGKGCMEQGVLGKLTRAIIEGDDFIEIDTGKGWDVKTASSESLEGKYIFDSVSFIDKLKDSVSDGENIILQISDLFEVDCNVLLEGIIEKFAAEELKKIVIIDAYDAKRTLFANQFLKAKIKDERTHLV